MKKTVPILLGLMLVSSGVWLATHTPEQDDREVPKSPPAPQVIETPAEDESSTAALPAVPEVTGDVSVDSVNPDAWEMVEYGDFVRVREYRRKCQTVLHFLGAGEGDEVTSCERRFEFDHPYALFTDAQLAQIARTDGEAAFILAHRQLYPAEPGAAPDIEAGVNNVLSAMIRGAEGQALDLLLDDSVFSPHADLESFLLWATVGYRLDIASPEQVERLLKFKGVARLGDIEEIEQKAAEIADLLREQRLIVLGTEF